MEKTNVALIGCGYWGKNHLKTIQEIDEAQLLYVCDGKAPSVKIPSDVIFTSNYQEI